MVSKAPQLYTDGHGATDGTRLKSLRTVLLFTVQLVLTFTRMPSVFADNA